MKTIKPMLAVALEDVTHLQFPVMVSPKLDGIRCLIVDGKAVSRTLKPIPNDHIRETIESALQVGMDGEIIIPGKNFNEIQSAVMTKEGTPEFEYHIFDITGSEQGFKGRWEMLDRWHKAECTHKQIKVLRHEVVENLEQLMKFEKICLGAGFEGVMIRSLNGPYKFGRSTLKEGYLLKLKRFKDAEAKIDGFTERMHNGNEAFKDELGHTKRSSHKANKTGTGMLGAFKVGINEMIAFEIGTGFTEEQRIEFWKNKDSLVGQYVKFKYQELSKDGIPRFPVFLGFRDERDM